MIVMITPKSAAITPMAAPNNPIATPKSAAQIANQIGNVMMRMIINKTLVDEDWLRAVIRLSLGSQLQKSLCKSDNDKISLFLRIWNIDRAGQRTRLLKNEQGKYRSEQSGCRHRN